MKCVRFPVIGILCLGSLHAAEDASKMELRGRVTGSTARALRVTLFSVGSPFTETTFTDPSGKFDFQGLPAGTYTLSIVRKSLGEIRRTVVLTTSLADRKHTVRMTIPYSSAEAAASRRGGTVSATQLSVPPRAWSFYADAQKHLSKRDSAGATRSLHKAVQVAPQFAGAWNSLGVIAYHAGNLKQAEEYFHQALAAEPEAFEPTVNLGGLLLNEGRTSEALDLNRKAVESHPADPLANAQLGITYFELGEYDHAEAALAAAQLADPSQSTRPQVFLAQIYLYRGNREAALRELKDCVTRHPDAADAPGLRRQIAELETR